MLPSLPLKLCEMGRSECQHCLITQGDAVTLPSPLSFGCCWSHSHITNSPLTEDSVAQGLTRSFILCWPFSKHGTFSRLKSVRQILPTVDVTCLCLSSRTQQLLCMPCCDCSLPPVHSIIFYLQQEKKENELVVGGATRYKPSSISSENFSLTLCIFSASGVNKVS